MRRAQKKITRLRRCDLMIQVAAVVPEWWQARSVAYFCWLLDDDLAAAGCDGAIDSVWVSIGVGVCRPDSIRRKAAGG